MAKRNEEIGLAEHLASKLCHDIAGTIGGIINSVEFLDDGNSTFKQQAEALLKKASKQLGDQFHFFRKLFGNIDINSVVDCTDLLELANNYLQYHKVKLIYDEKTFQQVDINGLKAKAIINIIYVCARCLIGHGEMHLQYGKDHSLALSLVGKNLKVDPAIEQIILNGQVDQEELSALNAQVFYTAKLIKQAELKFSLETHEENKMVFKLTKF
jgi:hypothetical protein